MPRAPFDPQIGVKSCRGLLSTPNRGKIMPRAPFDPQIGVKSCRGLLSTPNRGKLKPRAPVDPHKANKAPHKAFIKAKGSGMVEI